MLEGMQIQACRLGGFDRFGRTPFEVPYVLLLINEVMTVHSRRPSGSHTYLNKHANPLDEHSPL